jgi:signal transduction histidine kinase
VIRIKPFRNPEINRLLIIFALLLTGVLIAALLLSAAGRCYLKETLIQSQASLIGALTEKYPAEEQEILDLIVHTDGEAASRGKDILSRYGINSSNLEPATPLMQRLFRYNLVIYLLLPLLTGALLIGATLFSLKNRYQQIRGITLYTAEISRGNYTLDIRDNREGDLSILKNEIYKITTLLREQAAALQQEKAMLADSLADISHQLKTPLTSLSVLNDLLSEKPAEEKREIFLERMRGQLNRIEWLVSSLLKLSRLDAGAVTMKEEPVMVRPLAEKALAALALPLEIKMLQLRLEGDAKAGFTGDFEWSCEALINIMKNCIEHTPEEGSLRISYEQNPIFTVINIADSGAGIAPEDLPHIFTRFYKGKSAAPDQVGIGLAMARAIVEKQGGDITVKSEPGRGTEFTIKFYRTGTVGATFGRPPHAQP